MDVLIASIELTVGRDLQYIRFNGTLIGGLAGLALHALEQGLKLQPTSTEGGSHGRPIAELSPRCSGSWASSSSCRIFDMTKIMEHHQKNLEAMTHSWQAMASGARRSPASSATSSRRPPRTSPRWPGLQADRQPAGNAAKQTEFAKKAMEAAIANTRDIAELVQKSSTEASPSSRTHEGVLRRDKVPPRKEVVVLHVPLPLGEIMKDNESGWGKWTGSG